METSMQVSIRDIWLIITYYYLPVQLRLFWLLYFPFLHPKMKLSI